MTAPEQDYEQTLAGRIAALHAAKPWMDPQVTTTLASSNTSDAEVHSISDSLEASVQHTWDGISHFFDDPVLQKSPTPGLALQRYLKGTMGTWPVSDGSLLHIQTQLQAKGLGKDLPANGMWTAGWQAALQQHAQVEYDKQSAGDKPGSVSAHGFLHGLLDGISPSGIASAVVGTIKSIPADVAQLWGDLAGAYTGLSSGFADVFSGKPGDAGQTFLNTQRDVSTMDQRAIGADNARHLAGLAPLADRQGDAHLSDAVVSGVNDVGTLFLLSGIGSAAGGIAAGGRKGVAEGLFTRDLTTGEAMRGPGVVAKSLLRPVATRAVGGAATGGVVGGVGAGLTGHDIGQGIGTGALLGAVTGAAMPRRAFENLPVLRNTGPTLGKLTDAEGLYYKTRTRLATPYQYGAVRAAGTAMSQAQAFSLKAHGVAYLEHLFGGEAQPIAQSIASTDPLNGINDAIAGKLAFTAAGLHFRPDLDYLMYFLHGPVGVGSAGTASRSLKTSTDAATDGFNAALQNVGAIGQVEQGTGKSYAQLLKLAGNDPDRLHMWIGNKVRQHAAMQHAEEVLGRLQATAPDKYAALHPDDRIEMLRQESAAVWNDPEAMTTAVARLLGSNENYLARNIQNEIARAATRPDKHLRHELSDYLDAGDALTHRVLPHKDEFLLMPQRESVVPQGMDPAMADGNPFLEERIRLGTGTTPPGALGLARVHAGEEGGEQLGRSTLTRQQAARDLRGFSTELEQAKTPEAVQDFSSRALRYLFDNYAMDARKLSVFAGTPEKLLNLLSDRATNLASEVYLAPNAPADLVKAFAEIRAKGYRVVVGTDIGHAFRSDLPPLGELGAPISRVRKVVSGLGLNPQRFSRLDYGADRRLRVTLALQRAVDDGRITLPPYYTVQTLLNDLQDDEIVGKQLPWVTNVLFAASRRAHKGTIEDLIRSSEAESPAHAEALLKADIAMAGGLRQLSLRDVRRVLTRTDRVPWVTEDAKGSLDAAESIPLMARDHADEVFKAIQQGYSQTPAYMLGLQKVEDFARYLPFRFRDALAHGTTIKGKRVPGVPGVARLTDNAATLALMNLPNRIAQLRDTYRFTLSPYFSLRRIAKTNLKMAADGVVPTLAPVRTMRDQGVFDAAHDTLDRVLGQADPRYKFLDEADRYLDSQDVFGLYNPRHFEAYYAHTKAQQGWSDEQIHDGIVRVFQYGRDSKEGRTALERSVNVIFFPFSFEKTVGRNIGGYLLDKPAQALVLSNALDAYRDFNNHHLNGDNPLAASWYEQHLPLLQEVLRLNAFAHGISPGELGGVNRPLLNAFLPQSWETDKDTNKTLARFIPAMADAKRILAEGSEQSRIVRQSVVNGASLLSDKASGATESPLNPRPSNRTAAAQRIAALHFRQELIDAYQGVLDYNDSAGSDEEKYHFGLGPGVPDELRGAVIDKTNLGRIVHHAYPVYDPFAGAAFAVQRRVQAEQWLGQQRDTPNYERYADFYAKASTAIAHLNADEYPIEQAAQVQDLFHQVAVEYAGEDAGFYRWYQRTFASALGPLERI